MSPVPDPQVWAVDALTIPGANLLAYAFPLFSILRRVVRKARVEEASLFLVATIWVSKSKGLSAHISAFATTLKQFGRRSFSEDPLLRDVIRGVTLSEARSP